MVGKTNGKSEKPWYASKAVWGAVFLAAIGVAQIIINGEVNQESLMALAGAFGIFGVRDAL